MRSVHPPEFPMDECVSIGSASPMRGSFFCECVGWALFANRTVPLRAKYVRGLFTTLVQRRLCACA